MKALKAENTALKAQLAERSKQLYQALAVVGGMWNQYCPPPTGKCPYPGHMFMSAGEDCEELLGQWSLLRQDETAIDLDFDFEEIPLAVKKLQEPDLT